MNTPIKVGVSIRWDRGFLWCCCCCCLHAVFRLCGAERKQQFLVRTNREHIERVPVVCVRACANVQAGLPEMISPQRNRGARARYDEQNVAHDGPSSPHTMGVTNAECIERLWSGGAHGSDELYRCACARLLCNWRGNRKHNATDANGFCADQSAVTESIYTHTHSQGMHVLYAVARAVAVCDTKFIALVFFVRMLFFIKFYARVYAHRGIACTWGPIK